MRIPFAIPARGATPFDVVGLGENSVDLVAVVERFPAPNSKQRLRRLATLPGGQIATAMVAVTRLGWSARYLGSFGGDNHGVLSRDSLAREGVDVSAARTIADAANRTALIIVEAVTANRTVLWDRDARLTLTAADIPEAAVVSGRILIVDDHDIAAAIQAAQYARRAGVPTMVDVDTVESDCARLLQHIDAVVASRDFPAALTGYADPGRAIAAIGRDCGARVVTVTLGEEGSLTWCQGREIRTPAFDVPCVDTTGAGDVFRAGFIAGCLRAPDGELADALTYASAAAALNCGGIGARAAIPSADQVDRLISARASH